MKSDSFPFHSFCDDLGPAKVVQVYDTHSGLRGILVVDNVACGPAIGGIRMATDVDTEEVFRLARAMTLKNAAAGLAHGGGKAGIVADPHEADKRSLVRAFARAIRDIPDYIPGPDMGTDETCMGWIHDEIGRAVGLPRVLGGIPLDELGATGFGLAQCADVAAGFCELDLKGARVAIEGFGNVGHHAARFLAERGAVLVAASDSQGAVHAPDGLPVEELTSVKLDTGSVVNFPHAEKIPLEEVLAVDCDILVPAARPDSLHQGNVGRVRARLVLQGANIPATAEAEDYLHERGVLVVPDFIANAGGVICAAVEFHGGTESGAFQQIGEKIRRNTQEVLGLSRSERCTPRRAAIRLAEDRVRAAMELRV